MLGSRTAALLTYIKMLLCPQQPPALLELGLVDLAARIALLEDLLGVPASRDRLPRRRRR